MSLRLGVLAVCVLSAGDATAGPADPKASFRAAVAELSRREKAYFDEFRKRFTAALSAWQLEYEKTHLIPHEVPADGAYVELRKLAAELEKIETDFGAAAAALASSGHAEAPALLIAEGLRATSDELPLDKEIFFSVGKQMAGTLHDQDPAFRRNALAIRRRLLLDAVGRSPGAGPALAADGWRDAVKHDGKSAVAHRVFVLDALARCKDPSTLLVVLESTKSDSAALKIGALEAAVAFGPQARPEIAPALADPRSNVVRALLRSIRTAAAADAGWIRPVLDLYLGAAGTMQAEAHATLTTLTGRALPDVQPLWRTWAERHKADIDAGRFDRSSPQEKEGESSAPPAVLPAFHGIPTSSRSVVFVLDWLPCETLPSDVELAKTRNLPDWFGASKNWEASTPSNRMVTTAETKRFLTAMGKDGRFALTLLTDGTREDYPRVQSNVTIGIDGPQPADAAHIRAAETMMAKIPPGYPRAHDPHAGLMTGAALAGMPPEDDVGLGAPSADTVYLVSDGFKLGGRYFLPEMDVAAFARWNRFRQLVVHVVRIGVQGKDAELLLRGIAEASGGVYVRPLTAPK